MNDNRDLEIEKSIYSTGTSNSSRNHIFMIGIDRYSNNIEPLQNAVRDVKAIHQILITKYLFDGKHTILENEFATRKAIYDTFYYYLNTLEEEDNLIIYYAGHSFIDKKHKDAFWIPSDAFKNQYETYIDTDFIQRKLRQMKAKHVLLISDSCYSYGLFRDTASRDITTKVFGNEKNRSRYGFYSGRGKVSDGKIHSPFARVLIDYLEESHIDFYTVEMYIYMVKKMWIQGIEDQEPKYQVMPNTVNESGEFVFRLRKPNEEINFWRKVMENPTLENCDAYLKKYGDEGTYSEQVFGEIYKIKDRDKVGEIWKTTLAKNRIEDYEAFLKLYYYHSLAEEARKMITKLKRREKKKQDDTDWESTLLAGNKEGFAQYLQQHPDGRYVSKAQAIISSLNNYSSQQFNISEPLEIFEFYSNQNIDKNVTRDEHKLDPFLNLYKASNEFIMRNPNPLLYLLLCESIINEHNKEK